MQAALATLVFLDKLALKFAPRLQSALTKLSTDKNLKPSEQKLFAEAAAAVAQVNSFLQAVNSL